MNTISNYIKYLLLLVLIVINNSCFLDEFPVVESINPTKGSVVEHCSEIIIEFSEEMNKQSVERALLIVSKADAELEKYYLLWNDTVCKICFRNELAPGKYIINIESEAENNEGVNLEEDYISEFTVGKNNYSCLEILSRSPESYYNDDKVSEIRINFNAAIKFEPFEKYFSINPYCEGYLKLEDSGKTLIFKPTSELKKNCVYNVKIDSFLKADNGSFLKENYKFSFRTEFDNTAPLVDKVKTKDGNILLKKDNVVHGLKRESDFEIIFSEEMDEDSLQAIKFYGCNISESNYISEEKKFCMKISDSSENCITLIIPDTVCDIYNNTLKASEKYYFYTDSSETANIKVSLISQKNIQTGDYCELEQNSYLNICDSNFFYMNDNYDREQFVLTVHFIRGDDEVLPEKISLMENISLEMVCYNGNDLQTVKSPRITSIRKNSTFPNAYDVYIINQEPEVYYKLKIEGGKDGLKDSSGNNLKESFLFFFNT